MAYKVNVTRKNRVWLANVPEVAGAHTSAKSLTGLAKSVREVIIVMDDLDDAAVDLDLDFFDVSDQLVRKAARLRHERRELAEREAIVRRETATAVNELIRAGYSVRDTAAILGVTHGRVQQLVF